MNRPLATALALAALALACASSRSSEKGSPGLAAAAAEKPATEATTPSGAAVPEGAAPPTADRDHPPVPGPAPDLKVPAQRHFQLANGLQVRLVTNPKLPIVSLNLVVDAGAAHDPKHLPGLASFTAAMLTEGTARHSATELSDALGALGASLGAGTGFDAASLSGSALVARLDELLALFAEVLVSPTFPPADFERVKDQRRVALLQQRDQAGALAAKAFQAAYWGDHPYGHWPLGTEASLRVIKRGDLVRFHAAHWLPRGSTLVVVGDVTEAALRPKLESAFAAWKGGPGPAVSAPVERAPTPRAILVPKPGASPQTFVLMGMPGLLRSSPDLPAAEVAFEALGGGTSSRLFRELREKDGYTYGIYAQLDPRRLGGTSVVVGSVKTDVTGAATRALLGEVERMRAAPISDDELAVARNSILLGLPAEFATNAGIAGKLAEEVVYGLPDTYWGDYAQKVRAVTAEDVRRAAQRYLDTSRLVTVMVGDPREIRPQLDGIALGKVEVRPPARPPRGPPPRRGAPTLPPPAAMTEAHPGM